MFFDLDMDLWEVGKHHTDLTIEAWQQEQKHRVVVAVVATLVTAAAATWLRRARPRRRILLAIVLGACLASLISAFSIALD